MTHVNTLLGSPCARHGYMQRVLSQTSMGHAKKGLQCYKLCGKVLFTRSPIASTFGDTDMLDMIFTLYMAIIGAGLFVALAVVPILWLIALIRS